MHRDGICPTRLQPNDSCAHEDRSTANGFTRDQCIQGHPLERHEGTRHFNGNA